MLDYIVERKRMDDLAGSIIDGRFHEQKVSYIFLAFACIFHATFANMAHLIRVAQFLNIFTFLSCLQKQCSTLE